MKRGVNAVSWMAAMGLLLASMSVRADLLISPTRALLTAQQPVTQVTLRNTGQARHTYRMEWREMRRTDTGAYQSIEQPSAADRIASPMLRYSPRQITLEPGEMQTVRVQFQPPPTLTPGEYRSHLRFSTVGAEPASEPAAAGKDGAATIQIGLAFSIPVIVRVGEPEGVDVRLSRVQPRIETSPQDGQTRLALDVTVERSGAYSSFGDINVHMQESSDGPTIVLGKSTDFAVFADAGARPITIPLREDVGVPPGAWIRVSYDGKQEYAGRVLAEQIFQVQ